MPEIKTEIIVNCPVHPTKNGERFPTDRCPGCAFKKPAIIFDLDGTLAKKGDRGYFDWKNVGVDTLFEDMFEILDLFYREGYEIIIVTGRDAVCKKETTQWLKNQSIQFSRLFMRPEGNNEKDKVIKQRIYHEEIEPWYEIRYVFDDRNSAVEAWRELGLRCFQVAPGDF